MIADAHVDLLLALAEREHRPRGCDGERLEGLLSRNLLRFLGESLPP